ncbi:hypothetical protein DVA67_026575 [Solirubrobacter sp. CPCC 204708]|uniref:Uncharacterized protein n=1 Tax=Solirubrobacter deserti TaxID=2282478 RepID=A0ABT4RF57_9ACTN|nr:hypothetical protein [Solirubrobacter deserti]MBE2319561.1 hypothetical protein [Solirubrobacter deserti]MDA0137152.1 hypothetical protein [Solirubrobacter deserti]
MIERLAAAAAVLVAGCGGTGASAPTPTPTLTPTAESAPVAPLCEAAPATVLGRVRNPAVAELSGLVRTRTGTFWAHNDSGDSARVFELDRDGAFLREVALPGANAYDWEDIAIRGNTLFVGDIGDNLGQRPDLQVYQFPLPDGPATRINLAYTDGAHDAEALLVDPRTGQLAIVTKDFGGSAGVYTARRSGQLRKVAQLDLGLGQAVTAGDISADGRTIVLRSYGSAWVWERDRGESLAEAFKRKPCVVDAQLAGEGQGETLALSRDGRAFYTIPEGANPRLRRYGG